MAPRTYRARIVTANARSAGKLLRQLVYLIGCARKANARLVKIEVVGWMKCGNCKRKNPLEADNARRRKK